MGLEQLKVGGRYKVETPLERKLFPAWTHEVQDQGGISYANGEKIDIPVGVIVACLSSDIDGTVILEVLAAEPNNETAAVFVSEYLRRRFPSSLRTQAFFVPSESSSVARPQSTPE